MTRRTLVLTVGSLADVKENSHTTMAQALSDDSTGENTQRQIAFESSDELGQVFSPGTLDLLRTIRQEHPASVEEAARLVDRDIEAVSRDLDRLAAYEVVEYNSEHGANRPIVRYDDIQIHLPPE